MSGSLRDVFILSVGDANLTDAIDLNDGSSCVVQRGGFNVRESTIDLDLYVVAESANALHGFLRSIEHKLNQAMTATGPNGDTTGVTLAVGRRTSTLVFYDVVARYDGEANGWSAGTLQEFTVSPGQLSEGSVKLILNVLSSEPRGATVPYPVSGTLTSGSAVVPIANVPGDREAYPRIVIRDTSPSGTAINALLLYRRAGSETAADWSPIVNAAQMTGATAITDATAYGGSYARRTLTAGAGWQNMTRSLPPNTLLNRGRKQVLARVRGNAIAMGVPSGLSGAAFPAAPVGLA
ncbi:MAG: hypothetical protein M3440_12540, partial [Chloroflexota bacterium]|nr:hypothetical protein [Chloroflexota bacterium]